MLAESIERISPETDDKQQTVMFLAEQWRLLNAKPKGRRYSTDTLIRAFTWYTNLRPAILPYKGCSVCQVFVYYVMLRLI